MCCKHKQYKAFLKKSSLLIPEDSVDKEHLWKLQGNRDWNRYIKTTCWILQGNKGLIV